MVVVAISLLVIAAVWLLLVVAAVLQDTSAFRVDPLRSERALPVSVVVPARDEAGNIARCLGGLMAQRVREIVVVDDRSQDDTAEVVRELARTDGRIHLVDGSDPPEDRTGKINALVTGVEHCDPESEWLLFLDADVALNAGAVAGALDRAEREKADLLSLWGRWVMPAPMVRLLQPMIGSIVRTAAGIDRVNDDRRPEAFANGQFILVRKAAYDDVGGWLAVKDRILEDVAFARHAKAGGKRIRMYYGKAAMSVVPYDSLAELWNGYRKNFVQGAGGVGPTLLFAALVAVFSIYPYAVAPWILAQGEALPLWMLSAAGGSCVTPIVFRLLTARRYDHPPADAFLHPIANLLLLGLLLHAAWTAATGRSVPWKGRRF